MTEYDYSPEAYERYLQTQRRISNWVDKTEGCRPQFANALSPPSDYMPGRDNARGHHDRHGRRLQRPRPQHFRAQSLSDSEDSCSSDGSDDDYVHIRPSPPMRSAPAHLGGGFPAHQLPWNQQHVQAVDPNRSIPSSYYGTHSYREVKHRRAHSYAPHAPRPGQHYGAPAHSPQVVYVSPPVSPGMYPGYRTPPHSYVIGQHHGRPGPMPMVYIAAPC
ncbi:hypothetical protein FA13DRAFT_1788782 [Coprinellus micaceus]|uniref:Uncharacterized protein n=1 Tax=Coprinellus micaceus TaxID=71717 RepID=A0A4Y7TNR8_COPMI|nr:hypothetical protein FA13DRAFT_1788782 [Coprinellus micaceus]